MYEREGRERESEREREREREREGETDRQTDRDRDRIFLSDLAALKPRRLNPTPKSSYHSNASELSTAWHQW